MNMPGEDSVDLSARATSNDKKLINGTVKVYCTLGDAAGEFTLKVTGTGLTSLNYDGSDNVFTAYAVQSRDNVESGISKIEFDFAAAGILYDTNDITDTVSLTGVAPGWTCPGFL